MAGAELSAARWRTSSYSGYGNEGNCVEVAPVPSATAVRDSKSPGTGTLTLPARVWASFVGDVSE